MVVAKQEEEERLMEERIKAELEKDPDAIEEDIRKQVLMERQTRRGGGLGDESMSNTSQLKVR